MRTAPIFLAVILFAGCTSLEHSSVEKEERLQGHVTLVAGGADFIVTKPVYRRFQAPEKSFPQNVWEYVLGQPRHQDGSSLNGEGHAAWVDVSGYLETDTVFVATQVHQMGPASPRYLAWRKLFGAGKHQQAYAD